MRNKLKKGGCCPLESLWQQKVKYLFCDFYIAFKRFLTCGNDRSRQIIAKSGFKSEKLALCVELWPKHAQKRNLVPMFRYSGTPRGNGDCVQVHNGRYVAISMFYPLPAVAQAAVPAAAPAAAPSSSPNNSNLSNFIRRSISSSPAE